MPRIPAFFIILSVGFEALLCRPASQLQHREEGGPRRRYPPFLFVDACVESQHVSCCKTESCCSQTKPALRSCHQQRVSSCIIITSRRKSLWWSFSRRLQRSFQACKSCLRHAAITAHAVLHTALVQLQHLRTTVFHLSMHAWSSMYLQLTRPSLCCSYTVRHLGSGLGLCVVLGVGFGV